jgi:hypothetical protein
MRPSGLSSRGCLPSRSGAGSDRGGVWVDDLSRSQRQTPFFRSPSPGKPGRYLRSRDPGRTEPEIDSHLHFLFHTTSRCDRMKPTGTQRPGGPVDYLHQEDAGVQLYTAIDTRSGVSEQYLPLESVRRSELLSARSAGK